MDHSLPRLLIASAISVFAGVFALAACTHTSTDRIAEPVGGGDASTSAPEIGDGSVTPIGPVARTPEQDPAPDFTLVRSPQFGQAERSETQTPFVDSTSAVSAR
jgi:hypothetical protein